MNMKQLYLTLFAISLSFLLHSQPWINNLPQDKLQNGELTFYEIQQAFNEYWEPFNVKNGYYEQNGEEVKAPYWKQFKRWEWFWENRIDLSTGEFPNTSAWEELQKHLKEYPNQKSPTGNWTAMGPSTTSGGYAGLGRLNCVAFAANDANTIYVGSPSGGIWGSTNGGSTWIPLGDNNAVLGVSDILCFSPVVGPDILYIGTGDRDGGSMWSLGGGQSNDNNSVGILKSTDGGATWNATSLSFTPSAKQTVNRMLMDPADGTGQTQYAATSSGLYKTTDGWATNSLLVSTHFVDIVFRPGTSSTIYASNWNGDIYRSTNSGASFSSVYTTSNGRVELAVSANNSSVVYALMESGGGLGGVFKSTNGGTSFSQVYTGSLNFLGWNCNGGDSGGQGSYDLCIAADPNNANNVFVGGVNTWKSTDGGVNWSATTHWSGCSGITTVHADQHFLAYQNSTSSLYLCNDGGLYKTSNNGSSWTHHGSGLVTSQLYRLGVAQTTANDAICGLQDNGTKAQLSGTWYDVLGGDGMECAIDYTNHNTQYGESQYGNLYRTTNHWSTSTSISGGLTGSKYWVMPFVIDANVNTTLYAGTQDVFRSTNQGSSWTQLSSWGGNYITSLAVTQASSNVICAATQSILYRTTNGGSSWTNITGSLPTGSASITYVWIKDTDINTIWVSLGGYNSFGVYQTTNGGSTWTNISAGLPALPVMCVIQNKQNTTLNELYAGTDVGVYVKIGSANWAPFYSGLPNVVVAELDIYYNANPLNSRIRAATFGRGMWESDLYTNPVPDTWAGTVNSNWNLGANWVSGNVPTAVTDVTIPNAPVNWPVKTGNLTLGSDCKDLTMAPNAQLTVSGDFTINSGRAFVMNTASNLKVEGDWNNNGTFTPGMGVVDFTGISNATMNAPTGSQVNLINDNISTWPGNWNGDIGTGQGQFNQNSSSNAGGTSPEIRFYWINNTSATRQLYYNPVNTIGLSSLSLNFNHSIDHYTGVGSYTVKVQYSTDGTSWNDAGWSLPGNTYSSTPVTVNLTSAQGVGTSNYYIAFTITGNLYNINYWYIDDVVLSYNMPGTETFFDLTVSKLNTSIATNGNLNITNDFNLKPNAQFTNSSGNILNVTNNTLLEANVTGKASFIDNGTIIVGGTTIMESYYTDDRWHFISSPVSNAVSNIFLDMYLKHWNEADSSWTYISATDSLLRIGQGYEIWSTLGDPTVQYTNGILNTGNISPVVTATDQGGTPGIGNGEGWNFVGNPYPSAINWGTDNSPVTGYVKTNLDNTIYCWNGTQYATYNPSGNSGNGLATNGGSQYIQSLQSFFVKALNFNPVLTIPNGARIHSTLTNLKSTTESQLIRLLVSGNAGTDEIVIEVNENSTSGFDSEFDAYKLWGYDNVPQFYFNSEGLNLSVNMVPEIELNDVLNLGFRAGIEDVFTIEATEIENFDAFEYILLEDLKTNSIINLKENPIYSFTGSPMDDTERFLLKFSDDVLEMESISKNQINVYAYHNTIYVQFLSDINSGNLVVYDLLGQEIYRQEINNIAHETVPIFAETGYYLVAFETDDELLVKKVILQ